MSVEEWDTPREDIYYDFKKDNNFTEMREFSSCFVKESTYSTPLTHISVVTILPIGSKRMFCKCLMMR